MAQSFHGKTALFVCCKKPEALRKETPTKDVAIQKQPFPDVYKKGLLKNFLKLPGKHLYQSI